MSRSLCLLLAAVTSLATAAPAPAKPVQSSSSDHQLLAQYVERTIAATPSQTLPPYGPEAFQLLDTLAGNLDSVVGLSAAWTWCVAGMEGRSLCDGSTHADYAGHGAGSSFYCYLHSIPGEVWSATTSVIPTHQGPATTALYVAFYPLEPPQVAHVFPISLSAPYLGSPYCSASPNSVGPGAILHASGSTSIGANDLVLQAAPVPDTTGLFFLGTDWAPSQPFGDGVLCAGGSLLRLPPELASGNRLTHAVDFTDPASVASGLQPGSILYVQAWYRDPAAGGAGFNLSSALWLVLCP